MTVLPDSFRRIPIAHRGLHDKSDGRPENSRAAFAAAIEHGYGIELDLQPSSDGRAMVFHDYELGRLTNHSGPVCRRSAKELAEMALKGGHEGIPTLAEILELVDGAVPLLIEIKDQDGALGPDIGDLQAACAADLAGYSGPVAVMSFNPHAVAEMARRAADVPRGLTTSNFSSDEWKLVPAARRESLSRIEEFDRVGASFISHDVDDLDNPRVAELKARGATILCWTIRSAKQEAMARRIADNITFESYLPALPSA